MQANPGRPPEGMSPFEAIVNLYDESQRLAVELERHAEMLIHAMNCLTILHANPMLAHHARGLAIDVFMTATHEIMTIIQKMRANRNAKVDLVDEVNGRHR